ncbi:MAG: TIGR03936 family radical SAM-associated protein [Anaerovoracaceae bacterium]|jgi:radical SAM-linked protein
MSRYMIKFEKKGSLRFISHLDLMRLFMRTIRRAGIDLKYSLGYNPHPKLSIAQPLSLGFCSIGEYLEIHVVDELTTEEILNRINPLLPKGVSFLECQKIEDESPSLASTIRWGSYEVIWKNTVFPPEFKKLLEKYLNQKTITITKYQRKRKKNIDVDLKPMVNRVDIKEINENSCVLNMILRTGSQGNLNPQQLLESIAAYMEVPYSGENICICRTGLFGQKEKEDI